MHRTIKLYEQVGDSIGKVELVDWMGDDKRVVNAARVSFGKDSDVPFSEKDDELINYLLANRHTSPFEHCSITWKFVVPLFVRGQHHRHRTWSYNEISRRYTDENIQFYLPKVFRSQHVKNKQASNDDAFNPTMTDGRYASSWLAEHTEHCVAFYNEMLHCGIAREQARMVLPQNMYTEYYGTVDLHNAMHFLNLRLDPHSQWEIRRVAEAMRAHLEQLFPASMRAYQRVYG
jgi:thymidylate synthase (FAD)